MKRFVVKAHLNSASSLQDDCPGHSIETKDASDVEIDPLPDADESAADIFACRRERTYRVPTTHAEESFDTFPVTELESAPPTMLYLLTAFVRSSNHSTPR